MTKRIRTSGFAMTSALMLASSVPAWAVVTPALSLAVGSNSITIGADGSIAYGGTCTAATCPTTTAIAPALWSPGTVQWSGTIGGFTVSPATPIMGESKPFLTSPVMDLGTPGVTATGAGTLTIELTDIGFSGMSPTGISPAPTFVTGSGSVNYSLYVDNTNAAFGTGTLSASLSNVTGGIPTASGSGVTANPFSMTLKEAIAFSGGGLFSDDYSGNATAGSVTLPGSPMLTLTKAVVGATTVSPFTKVTYTYTVKNTGNVTLTNVAVTDDNGTPTYTKDDFTVCTVASLAAGASQTCTASVYPPVTQGANDCDQYTSFNYNNYHSGGQIICKQFSNGDVEFTYLEDEEITDNTYGSGSSPDWGSGSNWGSGWGGYWGGTGGSQGGNQLQNLQSKCAEFQVFDAKGNKCLDFVANYVSWNPNCISKYGTGSTSVSYGNGQCITSYHSSISDDLNKCQAFAQNCQNNSPSNNADWDKKCGYTVHISGSAWGSNGFGGIKCPSDSNGNTKTYGHGQHQCQPVNSTVTNTAVATAVYNNTTVTSNKATATVTIVATPPTTSKCVEVPTTCNVYGKSPSQCQPKNGGHDGDGYAYCDSLLGKSLTCKDGTPFQLGSSSGPCATSGGTIPIPNGKYSCLKFLGAGVNGNQYNQCFTITYTDGSKSNVYQNLSDWCYPSGFSGESIAASMPYRIAPDGSSQYINNNLYEYSLPCDNTKTVQSVTCPNNRNVVVHAITACQ